MQLGMCFDRSLPPSFVVEVAERLDAGGLDQLWVIEDCFYNAAPSLAATALARTDQLTVGIGILPAVARNAAVTAMELATLERLAPGRVIAGIGHGVQDWMGQMGARPASPLTTLEEVITAVKRLLAGERVSMHGQTVTLDDVALQPAPDAPPPVVAGVGRPKSLALAGRVADGLVLAEGAGPTVVAAALNVAGRTGDPSFSVSVFSPLCLVDDRAEAHRLMAPFVAGLVESGNPGLLVHPHGDEIIERHTSGGIDALAAMPAEWWGDLGAIGNRDDVVEHLARHEAAGVHNLSFFPGPTVELAREDLDTIIDLRSSLG